MEGVKALPDRVCAILCCCLQSAFHDGGRGSHRNSMVDAHVFGSSLRNCCVLAVWLDVETLPLTCVRISTNCSVCHIRAATEYRAPYHVGRVMTCQRTKNTVTCCVRDGYGIGLHQKWTRPVSAVRLSAKLQSHRYLAHDGHHGELRRGVH